MPIQHASDSVLKSMRRGLGQSGIRKRIKYLRHSIPDISLRTTLIVGYPGETDGNFNDLKDFIQEIQFDRLGVFTYSEEEGTIAADLNDNIDRHTKDERKNALLETQHEISLEKNDSYIGNIMKVIVDEQGKNVSVVRSEYDSPEIDNIVQIRGQAKVGTFVNVKIVKSNEYELIGEIV